MRKIIFTNEERELFFQAIQNLISETKECVKRNKRTQRNEISAAGTSIKNISSSLSFLEKYEISYKPKLIAGGGQLSSDPWIIFAPKKIIQESLINGDTLTPTQGIHLFICYVWEEIKQTIKGKISLRFGFPKHDINQSRCLAVNQMEKDGLFEKYDYAWDNFDANKDEIIDKFLKMINVFNQYPTEDFKKSDNSQNKTENNDSEASPYPTLKDNRPIPLNQILYGPPGTGKTYHTIDKALEILEQFDPSLNLSSKNRENRKQLFDQYLKDGQIAFVTFHQSYGYEEFVEGIKPDVESQEDISYQIKDGVFKRICKIAKQNLEDSQKSQEQLKQERQIQENIQDFLNQLIENDEKITKTKGGEFQIASLDNEKIHIKTNDTKNSVFVRIQDFEKIVQSNRNFDNSREMALQIFGEKNQQQSRTYCFQLWKKFQDYKPLSNHQITSESELLKPYILIIDEINRGNVSKIFGELITLIEESKRIGAEEELKVTLPYSDSKEPFGVPKNLYIIGTMNTADRSITAIDTALRRRFEFVEMMPNSKELSTDCGGINLQEMLEAINERIEFLLDREKTIGHAFFIGIDSIEDLKKVFQNKVIPLLQEYFYNDHVCIQAVLNDKMIRSKEKFGSSKAFNQLINDRGLGERVIYEIAPQNDPIWTKEETYKALYDDKNSTDENDQ